MLFSMLALSAVDIREAMLMVFPPTRFLLPLLYCHWRLQWMFFGFVYPFFQHEVLFEEVFQFICRVAEGIDMNPVFAFSSSVPSLLL